MSYIRFDENIHKDCSTGGPYVDTHGDILRSLPSTSNINIFVGSNNSGKSRFLRGLFKSKKFSLSSTDINDTLNELVALAREFGKTIEADQNLAAGIALSQQSTTVSTESIDFNSFCSQADGSGIRLDKSFIQGMVNVFEKNTRADLNSIPDQAKTYLTNIRALLWAINRRTQRAGDPDLRHVRFLGNPSPHHWAVIHVGLNRLLAPLKKLSTSECKTLLPPELIYIPTLRSLVTLYDQTNHRYNLDIFDFTIQMNYFKDMKIAHPQKLFTGLDFYDRIFEIRNDVRERRKYFEDFEAFLSKNFFDGKDVDIVARHSNNEAEKNISIYIGGQERGIHDVGDGIQALIMLLWPIYTCAKNSWIFIEEPEINLHPGMQRLFVEQICENEIIREKNLRIFFTTHSNHLIDMTTILSKEVSVFRFRENKKKEKEVSLVSSCDTRLLDDLGVKCSSVFMSNCTIWVEGPTDIKYIRKYLDEYSGNDESLKKFQEDIDYSFFIYGGSNIANYIFEQPDSAETDHENNDSKLNGSMLSNKIFLIADHDFDKEKKHKTFLDQQHSGFTYRVLKESEMENTLSPDALQVILPDLHDGFRDARSSILDKSAYVDKKLGKFLKNHFGEANCPKRLCAESGTLAYHWKYKLATLVSTHLSYQLMDDDNKQLAKELYDFIKDANA